MKYLGSKNRGFEDVVIILKNNLSDGSAFVEPFAGGCNMTDKLDGYKRYANDINEYLISFYNAYNEGWRPPIYVDRETYNLIRKEPQNYPKELVGWVGVNCSYCGVFMGSFSGITKTKGGVRNYQEEAIRNVETQMKKLKDVVFTFGEYEKMVIPEKSVIYCDPPYFGTYSYKIKFDHDKFYDWVIKKHDEGHKIFISEYMMPSDRFEEIWSKKVKSSLSANGKSGKSIETVEKLFIPIKQK